MFRIRRFGVVKTATTVAVLYMFVVGVFVILFGGLALLAGSAMPAAGGARFEPGGILALGLTAVLLYGLLGWVMTAIACALYNLVAGWVGGIEVQVERVDPPPPVPAWGATPAAPPTTGQAGGSGPLVG